MACCLSYTGMCESGPFVQDLHTKICRTLTSDFKFLGSWSSWSFNVGCLLWLYGMHTVLCPCSNLTEVCLQTVRRWFSSLRMKGTNLGMLQQLYGVLYFWSDAKSIRSWWVYSIGTGRTRCVLVHLWLCNIKLCVLLSFRRIVWMPSVERKVCCFWVLFLPDYSNELFFGGLETDRDISPFCFKRVQAFCIKKKNNEFKSSMVT